MIKCCFVCGEIEEDDGDWLCECEVHGGYPRDVCLDCFSKRMQLGRWGAHECVKCGDGLPEEEANELSLFSSRYGIYEDWRLTDEGWFHFCRDDYHATKLQEVPDD